MKRLSERSLLKFFVTAAATAAAIVMTTVSIALIATAADVTADTGKTEVTHEDITGIADIGNDRTPDAEISATPSTYIADGVYAIKNLYSGWYIDIAQDSPLSGKYVQQYNYTTSPANNANQRWGLYKVTRVSGNDYVIRTMINNGNTFVPVSSTIGSYLQTAEVPTSDSSVPNSKLWTITAVDGGYIIRPKGNSTLAVCVQNNTSSGSGATNAASRLTLQNRSDNYAKWTFTKLSSSITFSGVTALKSTSSIMPGETFQFSYYMYSSKIGVNGPITYAVTEVGSTAATDVATITSSGYLTAKKPGKFGLLLKISGMNNWGHNITVETPLQGCYFIQCYNRAGVWDTDATASGKQIECQEIDEKVNCLWWFEYQNNGYYAIRQDTSGYYVTNTNGAVKLGAKASSGLTNYQLWKLIKLDDGNYKIQSRANSSYYITEESGNHNSIDPDILVSNTNAGTKQSWYIKPLTLNLRVYYDPAFKSLYSAYSVTPEQFIQKVFFDKPSAYTNGRNIPEAFLEEFGVHVNIITYGQYQTNPYINDCELRSNGADICYGLPNCASKTGKNITDSDICFNTHHKNSRKMRDSTPSGNKNNWATLNILFTGHKPCYVENSQHSESGLLGVAGLIGDSYTRCAVFPQNFSSKTNYAAIRKTLMHEIMHILGATHHYTRLGNDNDYCVHGYYSSNSSSTGNYTLYRLNVCDLCTAKFDTIKSKLFTHN